MTPPAEKNIPVPGIAATRYVSKFEWQAGTVIRVHPGQKKLVWQRNTAVLVRENGVTHYEFVDNPDGECIEFSMRKSGNWAMVGKLTDKRELVLGVRSENSPAAQQVVAPENPGYHAEIPKIPGMHVGELEAIKVAPSPDKPILWMNLAALKEHLSCSHQLVYQMMRKGILPYPYKIGKNNRWNAHEVDQWILEKCKNGEAIQKQVQEEKYVRPARVKKNNRIVR